jgi:hypothetical protein
MASEALVVPVNVVEIAGRTGVAMVRRPGV